MNCQDGFFVIYYTITCRVSKENNYEELAYETVKLEVTLGQNPYKGDEIPIAVAKRDQVSAVIEV